MRCHDNHVMFVYGRLRLLENEATDVGFAVDLSTVGKTYMSVYPSLDKFTLGCTCTCMSTSRQQGKLGQPSQHIHVYKLGWIKLRV